MQARGHLKVKPCGFERDYITFHSIAKRAIIASALLLSIKMAGSLAVSADYVVSSVTQSH